MQCIQHWFISAQAKYICDHIFFIRFFDDCRHYCRWLAVSSLFALGRSHLSSLELVVILSVSESKLCPYYGVTMNRYSTNYPDPRCVPDRLRSPAVDTPGCGRRFKERHPTLPLVSSKVVTLLEPVYFRDKTDRHRTMAGKVLVLIQS